VLQVLVHYRNKCRFEWIQLLRLPTSVPVTVAATIPLVIIIAISVTTPAISVVSLTAISVTIVSVTVIVTTETSIVSVKFAFQNF
jgi:hypothetical protein